MVLFSKNALTKTWLLQSQRSVLAGTKTASTRNFTYFIKPIEKPFDYSSGNEGRGRTTMGTLKPYPIDSALPPSLLSGPLFYCTNTDSTVCYSTRHWGKENTPHLVV